MARKSLVNRAAGGLLTEVLRRLCSVVSNRRMRPCRRAALAGGDQMQLDRIVTSRTMATLRTRFPCVFAQRDEPAQPLNARVAHRPRLEVGQDFFKRHPRGRPIVSAVIQHPLRVENHAVLRSRQSRSWRISRLLARASPRAGGRKGGAVDVKRISLRFGSGAVASAGATTRSAAPI